MICINTFKRSKFISIFLYGFLYKSTCKKDSLINMCFILTLRTLRLAYFKLASHNESHAVCEELTIFSQQIYSIRACVHTALIVKTITSERFCFSLREREPWMIHVQNWIMYFCLKKFEFWFKKKKRKFLIIQYIKIYI